MNFKLYKLIVKIIISIIIIICIPLFLILKNSNERGNSIPTINQNDNSKFISEESLIKKINNVNKLITLEIELSQVVTIDQSYGDLDVLKKYKKIKFYSNCSYYIDLSQITKEDLSFNKDLNTLDLTIPIPKVYSISINKEKSKEEVSVNGFLRFGEIKLTTEEFKKMEIEVTENFENKLNSKPLFDEAKIKTKVSIENLIKEVLAQDVNLNISFK